MLTELAPNEVCSSNISKVDLLLEVNSGPLSLSLNSSSRSNKLQDQRNNTHIVSPPSPLNKILVESIHCFQNHLSLYGHTPLLRNQNWSLILKIEDNLGWVQTWQDAAGSPMVTEAILSKTIRTLWKEWGCGFKILPLESYVSLGNMISLHHLPQLKNLENSVCLTGLFWGLNETIYVEPGMEQMPNKL